VGNALFEPMLQCVSRYTATRLVIVCVPLIFPSILCLAEQSCTYIVDAVHVTESMDGSRTRRNDIRLSMFTDKVGQHQYPCLLNFPKPKVHQSTSYWHNLKTCDLRFHCNRLKITRHC